jgi:signal transduction histidine kinase
LRDPALVGALLDDARDGLLALDERGVVLEANEAAAEILARPRTQIVGKPFAAIVVEDERRAFETALSHLQAEEPARLRLRLGQPARRTTALLRVIPRVTPRAVSLVLLDDPASSRSHEHRTARPSSQLDHFFLRLPQAVVAIRPDQKVAFANQRARTLLGTEAVRVGRPPGKNRLGIDLAAIAERLVRIPMPLASAEVETADRRAIRISGVAADRDEPAVILLEDVTAQHRRDQPMREFIRNAAHQLRTPLTSIASAVEVLESGAKESPADRDRFLEHIRRHTDRLIRLSRGLLVLAHAQNGVRPRLEFVEIQPLLESLAASAHPAAGVTIVTECPASLAALGERDLLHEALAAIVDNAVKYTRKGEISLTAWDGAGTVTISVADSGPGILAEDRSRIFDPFHGTGADSESFGLGLAIAAQAVETMDGEIRTTDSPSGGTTFAIRLPSARIVR